MPNVILGIETSCDETSAAVLKLENGGPKLSSLVIYSQDVHHLFGGVVPELASRAHLQKIQPVVNRALREAGVTLESVDSVAVTAGPGLIGALLVGVCYAKALAVTTGAELIGVHHLEGHLFAPLLSEPEVAPPFVGLVVSGGHTVLLDVPEWGHYRLLGRTLDDAAGEAFDKIAKILGLGYPGGPEVEREAARGSDSFGFPRPLRGTGFDFSFSGLKTAVLYAVRKSHLDETVRANVAASFQAAVFDVLVEKVLAAIDLTGYPTVILGGGVACSRTLIQRMRADIEPGARVVVAPARLNADNAAMIARAGWYHLENGRRDDSSLEPRAALPWPGLVETHFSQHSRQ